MKRVLVALSALGLALTLQLDAAAQSAAPVKGEVLETMDVEIYTYLRQKTAEGETWAAVTKAPVKKGDKVSIDNPMVMNNFESRSLKRKFDRIVFGTLAGAAPGAAAPRGGAMPAMMGGGSIAAKGASAEVGEIKVARAAGADARTVSEVYAQMAQLKGKNVALRGKVVKFTGGVMGKNWVHLRDGSGSAADQSNDLLVTTKADAKVGDVVLARGVLRTDVDLGSGYSYKVLLEDASLQ